MQSRGQAALEQMLMVGLALSLIAILFAVSVHFSQDHVRSLQAKDAVEELANSIDYVYSLGPGAAITTRVALPDGVRSLDISGNRVHMRVSLASGDADFFANTRANVSGSLVISGGPQDVTLTTLESGKVKVGDLLLSCTPAQQSISLAQGEGTSASVSITNLVDYTLTNLSASLSGSMSTFTTLTQPSSSLAAAASTSVGLSLVVPLSQTVGTYSGTLTATASNSSECSSTITVFVTPLGGTDVSGPIVSSVSHTPNPVNSTQIITINAAGSDATTGGNTISYCQAELDYSGIWNAMNPTGGSYDSVTENINYVFGPLSNGAHTARLRCADSQSNLGSPTTYIFTVSSGAINDTDGPIVHSISLSPSSPTNLTSILVTATGDDSTMGGSNISMCRLSLDGGAYSDMNGSYTSMTVSVNYSLGLLSSGSHNISLRCNDTSGNMGNVTFYSFNVSSPDNMPPRVYNIMLSPSSIKTSSIVLVTAVGNDTNLGNNTLTSCELSVDNGAWSLMNASDGAYSSMEEYVNDSFGPLAKGSHSLVVRCNDSAGNSGNNSTSFTVTGKDVVFITLVASPSTLESRWITWFAGHTSTLGRVWDYDQTTIANVTGGSVNLSNYRTMVLAEAPASNTAYYSLLNASRGQGHYIVLLSNAMASGLINLGAATSTGTSASRAAIQINTSHYITANYTLGATYSISSASSAITYNANPTITKLASIDNNVGRAVILVGNNITAFGSSRPDSFNANGDIFATRVLDWAINNSTP